MEASLIDLRNLGTNKAKISSLIRNNRAPVVILLGHGSSSSLHGCSLAMLRSIPNAKVVWIYACECGISLIHKLAPRYLCVVGYATEVLAPETVESTVANKIREVLHGYSGEMDSLKIVRFVQDRLLNHALGILRLARQKGNENGLFLVQAALVGHTRLSLRIGKLS